MERMGGWRGWADERMGGRRRGWVEELLTVIFLTLLIP